jgi:tRNA U34 5-methylaminomethyl-2-thiouridine-forming methyltransferase MnmC
MPDVELIVTGDGSHSLRRKDLDETYHSIHGAIQESRHVFIESGLNFLIHQKNPGLVHLLEVGFGTGLNALLAMIYAQERNVKIHYTTVEPFPLEKGIISLLNYAAVLGHSDGKAWFGKLHDSPWETEQIVSPYFTLLKNDVLIENTVLERDTLDLVFFDAFAPSKQPAVWNAEILSNIAEAMKPGAVLVTYSAKGQLKRDLKNIGLIVESIAGPPGKKEMVRATKPE